MQYRTLGRTGVQVSTLSLGAMNFGSLGRTTQDDATAIVDAALAAGINLIDTADRYSAGESEQLVGKAIAGRRDDVVLATKVYSPMGNDPNQQGASRRWLVTELENSLRRMDVDHVDLYQVHRWDPSTSDEETLAALTDLQRAGKIRYFGTSTYPAYRIVQAQWAARENHLGRYVTEQPGYSILQRGIESHVLPVFFRGGYGGFRPGALVAGDPQGDLAAPLQIVDRARHDIDALSERLNAQCAVTAMVGDQIVVLAVAGATKDGATNAFVGGRNRAVPPFGSTFMAWEPRERVEGWLASAPQDRTRRHCWRVWRPCASAASPSRWRVVPPGTGSPSCPGPPMTAPMPCRP